MHFWHSGELFADFPLPNKNKYLLLRDTVAKIWIEQNGQKKIEIAWSKLSASEETEIQEAIDEHWDELNRLIDDVFARKKYELKE